MGLVNLYILKGDSICQFPKRTIHPYHWTILLACGWTLSSSSNFPFSHRWWSIGIWAHWWSQCIAAPGTEPCLNCAKPGPAVCQNRAITILNLGKNPWLNSWNHVKILSNLLGPNHAQHTWAQAIKKHSSPQTPSRLSLMLLLLATLAHGFASCNSATLWTQQNTILQ